MAIKKSALKTLLRAVLDEPESYVDDPALGELARLVIEDRDWVPPEPAAYKTWGMDGIDPAAHAQMRLSCQLPVAVRGALMPDAHVGYGLPIGGVLACEGAVVPYAVGVDIACRMKLSILDLPASCLEANPERFVEALERETRFGIGAEHERRQNHEVMDRDWTITRITRENKSKAWRQLGTSGSGNHFVEFGVVRLAERQEGLGLEPGVYLGLLSHSGSRGVGASVCSTYSAIARKRLPKAFESLDRLAWLDLDTEAGQEYWAAMSLMGDYAAANHAVIHRLVTRRLGAQVLAGIENHHNFAWREEHDGRELIVHRKGATPAGLGELGVIPGTMADPAFLVRGKGESASLNSAAHGAGRQMSRRQAHSMYRWNAVRDELRERGIRVLSAGADEVPGAYKDIRQVMQCQDDLVETIGWFQPRIVKMAADGSRPED